MRDTLVIMGSHPRTRGLFDFSRTDCDVWLFNEAAKQEWAKRADGVFQLHIPTIWRNPLNRNDPKHYEWLKTTETPVFMQEKYEDVPASVELPKDGILGMMPNARTNGKPIREVSCSPAWALAYGIYLGYKRIEVYGVELESDTEYHYQQGNWKFWVGVAAGRGIEIDLHTTMFDSPLYGYEGEVYLTEDVFYGRLGELVKGIDGIRGEFSAKSVEMWTIFKDTLNRDTTKELREAVQTVIHLAGQMGEVEGAISECQRYLKKADEMKKVSSDFVFSRQEFEQGVAGANKEQSAAMEECAVINGQLQLAHDSVVRMAKGSPKRARNLDFYRNLLTLFVQANHKAGFMRGASAENYQFMKRLDAGIKAAGGAKSEQAILGR